MGHDDKTREQLLKELQELRDHVRDLQDAGANGRQHAESMFEELLEHAPDGIVVSDLDGRIVMVNQQLENMLGYRRQELLGQTIELLIPERYRTAHPEKRQYYYANPTRRTMGMGLDLWARRKDGSEVPVDISLSTLPGNGQPLITSTIRDISARKHAEKTLRESEAKFRRLAEVSPAAIAIHQDERLVYVNPAASAITGFSAMELVASDFLATVHPDHREKMRARAMARLRGEDLPARDDVLIVTKSGEERWLDYSAVGIEFDNKPAVLVFAYDNTDRRRAEMALRQAEADYRGIFENALEGIFRTHPRGYYLKVNPTMARMLGYESPEELMTKVRDIGNQLYDDKQKRAELAAQMESAGYVRGFECQLKHKDGSKVWVAITAQAVRDPLGTILYYEGFVEDATTRKHLEEQLRQAQKLEAIGQLAGGVAHDFNNLLTVISGYSEVLYGQMSTDNPARKLVGEIAKAGERAASLTKQLLAFSRRQILQPQVLNLNPLVTELRNMLTRLIGEDVALSMRLDPKLGHVKADPGQIEQIVINLVVNARDAVGQGGTIVIETRNANLDESHASALPGMHPGAYILICVQDNGYGMNEATKARIFEPFFTTKGVGKGTGLGLATVYGIIKQSNGFIYVDSKPGEGTIFTIYFPQTEESSHQHRSLSGISSSPRGSETILLVEDEEAVRALASMALKSHGYNVLESRNGPEAIVISERHRGTIHLLVTDVVMPKMSGTQLAAELTSLRPGLKVLYLSGYTDDTLVRHAEFQPGTAFLQKPVTPFTLTHKVRETLDE